MRHVSPFRDPTTRAFPRASKTPPATPSPPFSPHISTEAPLQSQAQTPSTPPSASSYETRPPQRKKKEARKKSSSQLPSPLTKTAETIPVSEAQVKPRTTRARPCSQATTRGRAPRRAPARARPTAAHCRYRTARVGRPSRAACVVCRVAARQASGRGRLARTAAGLGAELRICCGVDVDVDVRGRGKGAASISARGKRGVFPRRCCQPWALCHVVRYGVGRPCSSCVPQVLDACVPGWRGVSSTLCHHDRILVFCACCCGVEGVLFSLWRSLVSKFFYRRRRALRLEVTIKERDAGSRGAAGAGLSNWRKVFRVRRADKGFRSQMCSFGELG